MTNEARASTTERRKICPRCRTVSNGEFGICQTCEPLTELDTFVADHSSTTELVQQAMRSLELVLFQQARAYAPQQVEALVTRLVAALAEQEQQMKRLTENNAHFAHAATAAEAQLADQEQENASLKSEVRRLMEIETVYLSLMNQKQLRTALTVLFPPPV